MVNGVVSSMAIKFKAYAKDFAMKKIKEYKPTLGKSGLIEDLFGGKLSQKSDKTLRGKFHNVSMNNDGKFSNAKMGKPIRKDLIKKHRGF